MVDSAVPSPGILGIVQPDRVGFVPTAKVRAARASKGDGEVIEEALRRHLGLDLLDRLWERNDLSEEEAVELVFEAQHKTRRKR